MGESSIKLCLHQSWSGGEGWGGLADPAFALFSHENLASRTFFIAFPNPVFCFVFFFFGKQINVRYRFALSIDILNYTLV